MSSSKMTSTRPMGCRPLAAEVAAEGIASGAPRSHDAGAVDEGSLVVARPGSKDVSYPLSVGPRPSGEVASGGSAPASSSRGIAVPDSEVMVAPMEVPRVARSWQTAVASSAAAAVTSTAAAGH